MYCMRCGYALYELTVPRCPECGRRFDPDDEGTFLTSRTSLRLARINGMVAVGGIIGCLALIVGALAFSAVGWPTRQQRLCFWGAVAIGLTAIVYGCLSRGSRRPMNTPFVAVLLIALALLPSVAMTSWPARIAFHLQRDELDTLANRIQSGRSVTLPTHVGTFTIFGFGSTADGAIYLWSEPVRTGPGGLMRCPRDALESQVNLWCRVPMAGDWYLVQED